MTSSKRIVATVVGMVLALSVGALAQEEASVITVEPDKPAEKASLSFNFRDAPLDTVLDYLSESAGFIIVREARVEGRVDVVSHQPLTKDEAIDLLNKVLNEKGFAALRNERTLTIVKREDAQKRDIPVRTGNLPEAIPKTDEMITQIIPVRHADATQLLENLQPLLPSYAVANANKSSNAIVLTDTQANVRRMAEIVRALDTSISSISEVKVYSLQHSKAEDVAKLVNSLFESSTTGQGNPNTGGMRQFFQRMRGGPPGMPGGPDDASSDDPDSAARQAAMRVQAVGDERTNSLVVSAPSDMITLIDTIVEEIDRVSPPATEIRVFPLKYADSDEMAEVITNTFQPTTTSTSSNNQQNRRMFGGFGGPMGGPGGPFGGGPGGQANSQQVTSDDTVTAVSDYRTNSVVVTAESTLMDQIAQMIEKLDSDPAREQKVFVYKLKNADAEEVAAIVQGLFPEGNSSSTTNRSTRSNTSSSSRSNQSSSRNSNSQSSQSQSSRFGQ